MSEAQKGKGKNFYKINTSQKNMNLINPTHTSFPVTYATGKVFRKKTQLFSRYILQNRKTLLSLHRF